MEGFSDGWWVVGESWVANKETAWCVCVEVGVSKGLPFWERDSSRSAEDIKCCETPRTQGMGWKRGDGDLLPERDSDFQCKTGVRWFDRLRPAGIPEVARLALSKGSHQRNRKGKELASSKSFRRREMREVVASARFYTLVSSSCMKHLEDDPSECLSMMDRSMV